MKKNYTLIIAILLSVSSFAQNYIISPSDSLGAVILIGDYENLQINLEHDNSVTDSIELQWEMFSNTTPAGWDFSICDYTNCYSGGITTGTMTKFGVNQKGFIKVSVVASDGSTSISKFKVWNTATPNQIDTLIFVFNATLGVDDIELGNNVILYPNPSNGSELHLENVLPNSSLTISNSLGQVIVSQNSISNSFLLENTQLTEGVYFIRLSRNDSTYLTRKLIVK